MLIPDTVLPVYSGRSREVRGDGHVPGASNEITKAVVVALLRAGRGRHGHDH
ncbi:MAG TPA: hypothetical protein VMM17_03325 [Gemmatimonadaceae bacterium]|nr:hypothetical protein [Gemmatimonadaceae bacterium]